MCVCMYVCMYVCVGRQEGPHRNESTKKYGVKEMQPPPTRTLQKINSLQKAICPLHCHPNQASTTSAFPFTVFQSPLKSCQGGGLAVGHGPLGAALAQRAACLCGCTSTAGMPLRLLPSKPLKLGLRLLGGGGRFL